MRGLVALAALLLLVVTSAGCKRNRAARRGLRVHQGRLLVDFAVRATTGARGPSGGFAVGTGAGGIKLAAGGRQHWLLRELGGRESAGARHDGPIATLEFAADGRHLLSVGGHFVVWWDLARRRAEGQLTGPQALTAGVVARDSRTAYFATAQGHVQRWLTDREEAEEVAGFECRPSMVAPERRRLDPARRCPVGVYVLEGDRPLCVYPVTQLVRRGDRIARACREGTVGVLDLESKRIRWSNVAGALSALTFVGNDLLFARDDGELRLWRSARGELGPSLQPGVVADAAASRDGLIAVARGTRVRLWHHDQVEVAGAVTIPSRAVWLGLSKGPAQLEILLEDGRLVSHPLKAE
jgi:hypothetical protein